jgi:hypothetical protein
MIDMKAIEAAYKAQICNCKNKVDALGNPVEMKMTLAQYADEWIQSNKWDQRGRKKHEYCMARHNDIGHYEKGNVRIITNAENHIEAHKGKPKSAESNNKRRIALTGRPRPEEVKAKLRKPKSAETKAKMSAAKKGCSPPNKGKPHTEESKAKMRGPKPKFQCPHCGIFAALGPLKRFHGDNCKKRPQ